MKNGTAKKIAFDFDKVFVNYPPLIPESVIDFLYKMKNHNLSYRYPGKIEQKIRVLSHYPFFRHPLEENVNSLLKISGQNLEIFLVSSRFSFLKKRTYVWLKKNGLEKYFKKMYFNFNDEQPHIFKDKIIKKEKIEKFVDDDLDLLIYLAQRNPKVNFFWLSSRKPNGKIPSSIKIVKSLSEFQKKYL